MKYSQFRLIHKKEANEDDVEWAFWNKWVPPKVNLFVWRDAKNRIPAKYELVRRGVALENETCSRCGAEEESVEHLLFKCVIARATWWDIMVWLKLMDQQELTTVKILFDEWKHSKVRWNSREFNDCNLSVSNTVEEIKEISFMWIKERAKIEDLVWERWKDFNVRDVIK
ncbi:uncharacterized protein LOC110914332 [Helianthus annuus]|uniref:uncharacterized protein LOC110914332 n=1 Tax=Helianthus annuus TaxID=4232 RepID=UPI000B9047E3|nr:uncharacterized protein LOC110914332 [Helianthus annuus]